MAESLGMVSIHIHAHHSDGIFDWNTINNAIQNKNSNILGQSVNEQNEYVNKENDVPKEGFQVKHKHS